MEDSESLVHLCLLEIDETYFFCLPVHLINLGTSLLTRFSDMSGVEDGRLVQMVKTFDHVSSKQNDLKKKKKINYVYNNAWPAVLVIYP